MTHAGLPSKSVPSGVRITLISRTFAPILSVAEFDTLEEAIQ